MSKIIKGDKVLIIAGKDKGKTGLVDRVLPKKHKVVVVGANMAKKHLKKSAKNPQGGIIDITLPIHISNVMLLDPAQNKPTRIGYAIKGSDKQRVSKRSGDIVRREK
ncbi:MAG: 50S ribosomal protein L24 [Candidatus Berkelbacteria bacterium]|nr:MAG: 50S ribosomal protein L24 [Candidatus Berkelbacteria bacterium]QQG52103.1 MAG: 50S ribosomal protein L24 [Candidatus Berkelbacteria bacterium]